jgi:hypothetical protein
MRDVKGTTNGGLYVVSGISCCLLYSCAFGGHDIQYFESASTRADVFLLNVQKGINQKSQMTPNSL